MVGLFVLALAMVAVFWHLLSQNAHQAIHHQAGITPLNIDTLHNPISAITTRSHQSPTFYNNQSVMTIAGIWIFYWSLIYQLSITRDISPLLSNITPTEWQCCVVHDTGSQSLPAILSGLNYDDANVVNWSKSFRVSDFCWCSLKTS